MLFNSYSFLLFFPIVVLINFIIPKKIQYIWLLITSYYFYMNWDAKYVLLLLFSTIVTYASGILLDKFHHKMQKKYAHIVVAASFVLNLGILFVFKYFDFAIDTLNFLLQKCGISIANPEFNLLLPVGISFYIFQALSYTMDVYRRDVEAEHNFLKYALFVSFFPQLVAGPIERSKNLLKQVNIAHTFRFENMREGLLLMLWGYFQKLVIADRAALLVDTVFQDVTQYSGVYFIVASVLFAFQIYCDFSGYSIIAIGAAKILGFHLMENFNCPYFSASIKEFWRRWHISLSSWFRDYLYIPLGGSRKGTLRKYANLFIVFFTSGLWHGAAWNYVAWGVLHGIYQIIGGITRPFRDKINKFMGLKPRSIGHKFISILITFGLADFAWIFFRANSFQDAVYIIKSIFTVHNIQILRDGSLYELGLNFKNMRLLFISMCILMFADFCKYKGIQIRKVIFEQELWCRWLLYLGSVVFILIFGIWGGTYDASSFIYFQF